MPLPFFKSKAIDAGTEFIQAAGSIIDSNVTSQQERGVLKNQFTTLLTQMEEYYEEKYTERYISDNRDGNWLSKSARPIVVIMMAAALVAILFIPIPDEKWDYVLKFTTISGALIGSFFGLREIGKGVRNPISDYNRKLRRKG